MAATLILYSGLCGKGPHWQVISKFTKGDNMGVRDFADKFNIILTDQQLAAMSEIEKPCLLLAVPGSGKTTTLVARIGYMIYEKGILPESILTMTYTVAASRDMKDRFVRMFGAKDAGRLRFSTINSVCAAIIRTYNKEAFSLLENNASLIREVYQKAIGTYAEDYDVKRLQLAITYIKNMQLEGEEIKDAFSDEEELQVDKVFKAYEEEMRRRHLMDFDDQLVYALRILRKFPDILNRFQKRYKYILVDEAQDTSKIQHDIVKLLSGSSQKVFMVGDEDQSIYGFRAAYPKALLEFKEIYPEGSVLYLEENFRSASDIVEKAARFIKKNTSRYDKKMFTKNPPYGKVSKVEKWRPDQYDYLYTLCKNEEAHTAILYRNNDSAVPVIYNFRKKGLACRWKEKDNVFFSAPATLYALDFFRLVINPHDADLFLKIYYKLNLTLKREEAAAIAAAVKNDPSLTVFAAGKKMHTLSDSKKEKLREAERNFKLYRTSSSETILSGLERSYNYYKDAERIFILRSITEAQEPAEAFLLKLLELKAYIENGSNDEEANIILSTIHSSKGLEYDKVILIDAFDGIFAMDPYKITDPEYKAQQEEDRRLFYVGVTRAKRELLVIDTEESPFIRDFFRPERKPPLRKKEDNRIKIGASSESSKPSGIPAEDYKRRRDSEKVSEAASLGMLEYMPGAKLMHKQFGIGQIIEIDDKYMQVKFPDATRKLNTAACISGNIIKPV